MVVAFLFRALGLERLGVVILRTTAGFSTESHPRKGGFRGIRWTDIATIGITGYAEGCPHTQ